MSSEETLADVCYRHPNRTSWVLCQRCGRTICPECQIQAPVGVHCPECVREANGGQGPRWTPVGGAPKSNVTPMRRRSPGWVRWLQRALLPDSGRPVVSWIVVAAIVIVFIANLVTNNFVALWLAMVPGQEPWEIWRFFTSALVSLSPLSVILNAFFFLLLGPTIERMLGRARFATVLLAGAGVGSAAMMLAGALPAFGLTGAMFGMFAAYFVIIRSMGAPTTQFIVLMGVNVVITLVLAPIYVVMLVGGVIGGGGAAALFFWHRDKGTRNAALPYWQIAGGVAAFIAVALIRSAVFG